MTRATDGNPGSIQVVMGVPAGGETDDRGWSGAVGEKPEPERSKPEERAAVLGDIPAGKDFRVQNGLVPLSARPGHGQLCLSPTLWYRDITGTTSVLFEGPLAVNGSPAGSGAAPGTLTSCLCAVQPLELWLLSPFPDPYAISFVEFVLVSWNCHVWERSKKKEFRNHAC